MNQYTITPTHLSAALAPATQLAEALGCAGCDKYEIDGTVLRAYLDGRMLRAWDLALEKFAAQRPAFDFIVAEIARLKAAKVTADEDARLAAEAERIANPPPVFVDKHSVLQRVIKAGKLTDFRGAIEHMSPDEQFEFAHAPLLDVSRKTWRDAVTAAGLESDTVLAP